MKLPSSAGFLAATYLAATVVVINVASATGAEAGKTPTVEKVLSVWKDREARTTAIDFTWRESKTGRSPQQVRGGEEVPVETAPSIFELALSGDRTFCRMEGPLFSVGASKNQHFYWTIAGDGKVVRTLNHQRGGELAPNGSIRPYTFRYTDLGQVLWRPVMMHFRPTVDESVIPKELTFLAEPGNIRDRPHHVMLNETPAGRLELWVDELKDWSIARLLWKGPELRVQFNIAYSKDEEFGYYPSSWTYEAERNGEGAEVRKCTVIKYAINKPVPDERLAIVYPTGARIRDIRNNKNYIANKKGELREVLPSEQRARLTPEQLLQFEPGTHPALVQE